MYVLAYTFHLLRNATITHNITFDPEIHYAEPPTSTEANFRLRTKRESRTQSENRVRIWLSLVFRSPNISAVEHIRTFCLGRRCEDVDVERKRERERVR